MLSDFLNVLIDTLESELNLSNKINISELDTNEGISVELVPTSPTRITLNKKQELNLKVLFLRKSKNKKVCMDELESIGNYLTRRMSYPNFNDGSWSSAKIISSPSKVTREENGNYTYSMMISCKLYF